MPPLILNSRSFTLQATFVLIVGYSWLNGHEVIIGNVGIGWAVAMKKPDFIGKTALEKIKQHPPKVAVGLVLEGNETASHGQWLYPINERWRVGMITSATFSPILNRSIALAQVVPEYATIGTELEVGLIDGMKRRVKATVGPLSAYDPTKSRVKS